jgi:hypothetical protein
MRTRSPFAFGTFVIFVACSGGPCSRATTNETGAPKEPQVSVLDAGSDSANPLTKKPIEDDDPIPEAGLTCKPTVELEWDDGLPDFHFSGFPCVSNDGQLLAYAAEGDSTVQGVVLVNLAKKGIEKRLDLITQAEVDSTLDGDKKLSRARYEQRTKSANQLFAGKEWTTVVFAHGTDELDSTPLSIDRFTLRLRQDRTLIVTDERERVALPIGSWFGSGTSVIFADIAIVPAWGMVLTSVTDAHARSIRIVPWSSP